MTEKKTSSTAATRVKTLGKTYVALAKAQSEVEWVQKSASNSHHRYNYVPVDMMVRACKKALINNGLVLVPVGWELRETTAIGRWILHSNDGGESVPLSFEMPVLESKGRAGDKAYLAAQSSALKYLLRDLLMVPMLEEEVCDRIDDSVQTLRKAPPQMSNVRQQFLDKIQENHPDQTPAGIRELAKTFLEANNVPTDGTATDEQVQSVLNTIS